jgi:hypothetical protein
VDPFSDPLLLRESGKAGNGTQTSGSVARNSDHQTAEAVTAIALENGKEKDKLKYYNNC